MIRNTHLTGSAAAVAAYMESKHEEHLTRSGEQRATGYYSMAGGAPCEWFGKGAAAQGLAGAVTQEDMIRALSGTVKHTGEDVSTRGGQTAETRRMGEELTIAAPKSVSIMSVEDPRIIEAHQKAVRAAMAYVEKEMVHARIGKGGGKGNDFAGNLTAGLYVHEDARDSSTGRVAPHLHTHAVISNMTQRADGKWVSLKLDWGHNNEKKMAADSVYKAELAREIKALGYQIEKGQGSNFEIAGISRDQIEYFSPRSQDIKKEIGGERSDVSAKERQAAQNKTKGNKSTLNNIDQRYEWRREFRDQNMDLHSLHDAALRRESLGVQSSQITAEDALKSAIRHLSERDSVFSEQSLKTEALAAGLGDVSALAIDAAIEARAGGLVYAGQAEGLNDRQFTTKRAIFTEAEILYRGKEGRGKSEAIYAVNDVEEVQQDLDVINLNDKEYSDGKRIYAAANDIANAEEIGALSQVRVRQLSECDMDAKDGREDTNILHGDASASGLGHQGVRRADDDPRVEKAIATFEEKKGFSLGDGQKAAVALALTSEDQHMAIVGAAGAGKTTSMELIVEQYRQAGYEIIGVAPSAAAAKELQAAGCDETRTLASSLLKKDKEGETPDKRLYIMDEAGMVSAKDFDTFLRKAGSEGARTLLVGDPLQLSSVEAGSPFAQLLKNGSIAHADIDEIQRQKDPQLREIAQAFARGDAGKGVELAQPYMTQVRPTEADTEFVGLPGQDGAQPNAPKAVRQEALSKTAAQAYLDLSTDERSKTLLLSGTNDMRQSINSKIRDGLVAEGTLGAKAITVTALDRLDLTRENATHAENYVNKEEDKDKQVVVQFNSELKNKEDRGAAPLAEKGSQWNVVGTSGGKLQLQLRDDPAKTLEIRPNEARISAYVARKMELREGDQIMFRQNDKALGVTNGTQGNVVSINEETGQITVETQAGDRATLEKDRAEAIDYSYARTVHSAQGATVERAIVVGEASRVATAAAAYVALSREKLGLQIITDNTDKLSKAWSKFAKRQNALDAVKTQAPETLNEIQQARHAADYELGQTGDLSEKRAPEHEPEHVEEPGPEPAAAAAEELEDELEL